MAKITCKGLTYAKYSSGGEGSAIVYSGGKAKLDYLCRVDMGENRGKVNEYADGHEIDVEQSMSEATVNLELANTDADIKKDLLGYQTAGSGSDELNLTDDDPPYVGVGFILMNRFKGAVTYEAYWYYKVQFVTAGQTSSTKTEQVAWEHETINGTGVSVQLAASGANIFRSEKLACTTEAAARTWLNGKAGITGN